MFTLNLEFFELL